MIPPTPQNTKVQRYLIYVPVTSVEGSQVFVVNAESEEAARDAYKKGQSEWLRDDFEVQGLDSDNVIIEEES